jgi:hypothetical protein
LQALDLGQHLRVARRRHGLRRERTRGRLLVLGRARQGKDPAPEVKVAYQRVVALEHRGHLVGRDADDRRPSRQPIERRLVRTPELFRRRARQAIHPARGWRAQVRAGRQRPQEAPVGKRREDLDVHLLLWRLSGVPLAQVHTRHGPARRVQQREQDRRGRVHRVLDVVAEREMEPECAKLGQARVGGHPEALGHVRPGARERGEGVHGRIVRGPGHPHLAETEQVGETRRGQRAGRSMLRQRDARGVEAVEPPRWGGSLRLAVCARAHLRAL